MDIISQIARVNMAFIALALHAISTVALLKKSCYRGSSSLRTDADRSTWVKFLLVRSDRVQHGDPVRCPQNESVVWL